MIFKVKLTKWKTSAGANNLDRARQIGVGSHSHQIQVRDRSNDSTGHNSDDDTILSGPEDEDGNNQDQGGNGADGKGQKARKKKTRTVFSRSQVFQLESTFDIKRYLSSSERAGLAASLQLTETQVRKPWIPDTQLTVWNWHMFILGQDLVSKQKK